MVTDQARRSAAIWPVACRAIKAHRFTVVVAGIAMVGSAMVLLRTATYGIAWTYDTSMYITTAQNLLEGRGFTTYFGSPYGALPYYGGAAPLYPAILAIFSFFSSMDIIEAARYINALAFGLVVFVVAIWLRTRIESRFLVIWAASACVLSVSFGDSAAWALTEILFTLGCMASLFALDRFLDVQRRSYLIWAALGAAAALLTRYMGVVVIGTGLVVICLQKRVTWRAKLSNSAIWSLIAFAPLGLWILRNIVVLKSTLGRPLRTPYAFFSHVDSLRIGTNEITEWILGPTFSNYLADRLALYNTEMDIIFRFVFLVGAAFSIWVLFTACSFKLSPKIHVTTLTMLIGFVFAYGFFLLLLLIRINIDLSARFLIPLFPPLVVVVTVILDQLKLERPTFGLRFNIKSIGVRVCGIALLTVWLMLWIGQNYDSISLWNSEGQGFRSRSVLESETSAYISDRTYGSICSDDPAVIYFGTDEYSQKRQYSLILPQDLERAKAHILQNCSSSDGGITWFFVATRPFMGGLGAPLKMEVVAVFADSAVPRDPDSVTWDGDFLVRSLFEGVKLVVDSHFEVYVDNQFNRLIYVRRSRCGFNDIAPEFIVHAFPVDEVDLPSQRQQYAFDDLSFYFPDHANFSDQEDLLFNVEAEYCIAVRSLPDYDIAAIRTGQVRGGGDSWMGEFALS